MIIRKAVVTAAGVGQRSLPLQTLVDRDGVEKKALQIILEEAFAAGVEQVCVVVAPGTRAAYAEAARPADDCTSSNRRSRGATVTRSRWPARSRKTRRFSTWSATTYPSAAGRRTAPGR